MPFFSKVFRSKDRDGPLSKSKKHSQANGGAPLPPPKPRWEDAWLRKTVEPEEIQELLRGCTHEVKSRGKTSPGREQQKMDMKWITLTRGCFQPWICPSFSFPFDRRQIPLPPGALFAITSIPIGGTRCKGTV
jgi:hypothetical protein